MVSFHLANFRDGLNSRLIFLCEVSAYTVLKGGLVLWYPLSLLWRYDW